MAHATVPFIVAVCGALLYGLVNNGKLQEIGRILFAVGALVTVWTVAAVEWSF